MITDQSLEVDRKAAAAAHWMAEIAYRMARNDMAAKDRANSVREKYHSDRPNFNLNREIRRILKRSKKK